MKLSDYIANVPNSSLESTVEKEEKEKSSLKLSDYAANVSTPETISTITAVEEPKKGLKLSDYIANTTNIDRVDVSKAQKDISNLHPGMLEVFGNEALPPLIPATAGMISATAATPFGAPLGPPGMFAANLAGGMAGETAVAKLQHSIYQAISSEEEEASFEDRVAAGRRDHPFIAKMGGLAGSFPMMLSARGLSALIAKRTLEKTGVEITKEALENETKRLLPRLAEGAASFGTMSASAAATSKVLDEPGSEDLSIINEYFKGLAGGSALGLAGKPLDAAGKYLTGLTPGVKNLEPAVREYLFNTTGKAFSDAAVLTLANGIYDQVINDKPMSLAELGMGTTAETPAFMLMNAVLGAKGAYQSQRLRSTFEQNRAQLAGDFNVVPEVQTPAEIVRGETPRMMYEQKAGIDLTPEHVQLMMEKNMGLSPSQAVVASKMFEAGADGQGLTLNEFFRNHGLALGVLPERPVGYAYEFNSTKDPDIKTKLTKQSDGSYVREDVKISTGEVVDTKPVPAKDLQREAMSLKQKGYTQENFNYSMGEQSISNMLLSNDPRIYKAGARLLVKKVEAETLYQAESDKVGRSFTELERKALNQKMVAQTGWYRDLDGKMKYVNLKDDITFKDMALDVVNMKDVDFLDQKTGAKQGKLSDMFDVESFKEAYPDLYKEIDVVFFDMGENVKGSYDNANKTVYLNSRNRKRANQLSDTFRHELQHAIQYKEGFGLGANADIVDKTHPELFAREVVQATKFYENMPSSLKEKTPESAQEKITRIAKNWAYDKVLGEMESRQATRDRREQNFGGEQFIPTDAEMKLLGIKDGDVGVKFQGSGAYEMETFNSLSRPVTISDVDNVRQLSDRQLAELHTLLEQTLKARQRAGKDTSPIRKAIDKVELDASEYRGNKGWIKDWKTKALSEPETMEAGSKSSLKERAIAAGYTLVNAFHGSKNQFIREFKVGHHLGIHFSEGRNIADSFVSDMGNIGKTYSVALDLKNPLRLQDRGTWDHDNVILQMERLGVITREQSLELMHNMRESRRNNTSFDPQKYMREYIKKLGYDGIIYLNRFEVVHPTERYMRRQDHERITKEAESLSKLSDEEFKKEFPHAEDSYIVFEPNQIKSLDEITKDTKGNEIPLDKRFNKESSDIYEAGSKSSPLGTFTTLATGEKLIRAFEGSNFSVIMHEFGHFNLKIMDKEHFQTVADWAQTKGEGAKTILKILEANARDENLTTSERAIYRRVHEKFANSFEEYLRQGKAPNTRLKELFDYAKNILTDIWFGLNKVPGSKLDPEITKVFDSIFMNKYEKFNGDILTPQQRIKSADGTWTIIPPTSYKIFNHEGQASIQLPGKDGKMLIVDVENIIKSGKLTPEQKVVLGDNARWQSTYAGIKMEQTQFSSFRDIKITRSQLADMPEKRLQIQAKKFGFASELYTRPQLEDLIWGKIVADSKASLLNASDEQLADSLQYHPRGSLGTLTYNWSAWIIDRIRDIPGGSALVGLHHQKGTQAIADTHQLNGIQESVVKAIQKLVRLGGKGVDELARGVTTTHGFISNVAIHLDGSYHMFKGNLSPEAQKIVDHITSFLNLQAEIAEKEQMSIRLISATGEETLIPFHGAGNKFPRLYTKDFWAILSDSNPFYRKKLALAIAEVNPGMRIEEAQQLIGKMAEHSVNNKRLYMELARQIEVMPTHLRDAKGGLIPLLETDIFNYVAKLQHKLSMRVGFFRQYSTKAEDRVDTKTGEVIKSNHKYVDQEMMEKYVEDFNRETGYGVELERLFNALNGVPLTHKYDVAPGHPAYKFLRGVENYLMLKRSLWMTKSLWVNVVEPTIKTPAIVGWGTYGDTLKDFGTAAIGRGVTKVLRLGAGLANKADLVSLRTYELLKDKEAHDAWNIMKEQMIQVGSMAQHLARFTIDPNDAVRSSFQTLSGIISKGSGTTGAITFGEYFSSWAGHLMSQKLRAGKGTQADIERLRVIGVDEATIQRMIIGDKTLDQKLFDDLPGKIARLQMGTSTLPAERSLWHNWRHASTVVAFDRFGATTLRYYNQVLRSIYLNKDGSPVSKYEGWRRLVDNLYTLTTSAVPGSKNFSPSMATLALTAPMAGLAMMGIRQLVSYGPNSFAFMDWDDKEESNVSEYMKLYADCYIASTMSGPLSTIYTDFRKGQLDTFRTGSSAILPLSAAHEIVDMVAGQGMYLNKDSGEKAQTFMKSSIPVAPALASWFSIFAHGVKDPQLEAARANFYKWRNKNVPGAGARMYGNGNEETELYHQGVNHAYSHIMALEKAYNSKGQQTIWDRGSKEYAQVKDLMGKALNTSYKQEEQEDELTARKRIAQSFLGKRLLTKLNKEQRAKFYAQGNQKVLTKLEEHDAVLTWVANKIEGY